MTDNLLAKVRELEGVLTESWPAAESELRDGWLLQATDGFTGRANSVAVVSPSTRPAAEALTDAERWYRRRELPPMVRVTPLSGPELETELDTRGYVSMRTSAVVMVRSLTGSPEASPRARAARRGELARVRPTRAGNGLEGAAVQSFLSASAPSVGLFRSANESWWDLSGRGLQGQRAWSAMSRRLGNRTMFAAIEVDGQTVAVGQGALASGYVSLFGMKTRDEFRRRGLAAQVVAGLEAWGWARGARKATLQVETHNAGAGALYRKCGYQSLYDYRYLGAPDVLV